MKRRFSTIPESLCANVAAWFRERIDLGPVVPLLAKKTVPIHSRSWVYLLGGAAMFLFGLQVVTGAFLMLYYQPTEAAAYASVQRIMADVPYGWLIRSMHVWGADLFVAVVCLHLLTTLLTKAYRKPRELTWLSGVFILMIALGFGFSGYLLPWTTLSYYATLVGTQIPGTIPIVGDLIVHFLRGGAQVTGDTITRFFAAHVMILPLALAAVLSIHLLLIQAQGISLPLGMSKNKVKDNEPFFTEFMLADARVWLVLFGAIVTLSVFLPAHLGSKADPLQPAPAGIQPEWYFLFMFQTLKMVPEAVGVVLMTLGVLFLIVFPFLDRRASRDQRSPGFTILVLAAVAYIVVFQVLAVLTPGAEQPPAEPAEGAYRVSRAAVSLALFWSVIVFLIAYLRRLRKENARVRKLYSS